MWLARSVMTATLLVLSLFLAACGEPSAGDPEAAATAPVKTQAMSEQSASGTPGALSPCCVGEEPAGGKAMAMASPVEVEGATAQANGVPSESGEPVAAEAPGSGSAPAPEAVDGQVVKTDTWRSSPWLDPAAREEHYDLNWEMTDDHGTAVNLKSLVGRPIVVSFIYTRCPNPVMCPLTGTRFADLERRLAEAGLGDKVQLWLVSFDPAYDTPERLKMFAAGRGVKFTSVSLFRPKAEEVEDLKFEFGVATSRESDGSIAHYTDLFLIDGEGRFVRYYTGGGWDNAKVMLDLARLAGEVDARPAQGEAKAQKQSEVLGG